MSARRLPVDEALIPPRHLQAIKQALRANATVELNGIAIHPPTGARGTWRVKTHLNGRPVERSGGRTIGQLYAAFLAVVEAREHTPVLTGERPALEQVKLMAALDRYIAAGGKDGKWGDSSRQQSKAAFTTLREMFGARRCADITDAMLREALSASAGTHSTGRTRWGRYATFLEWGMTQGYFTERQSTAMDRVQWAPPVGSTYRRAATRREQAKQHFPPAGLAVGGNVMTHQQVRDFAAACQERYAHGSLLIFASADLGTRSAETRLFTADPAVMAAGLGNYVDLEAEVVRIRFQAGSGRGKGAHLPKVDRQRDVVIPSDGNGANKHATLSALRARAEQARAEQARGENPLALYFPTSIGTVLNENNLRERVWGPAADALGWRMPDYQTAKGRTRAMRRFTLHSLRDFFATMAINEWHYTEESLLWQGAWTDLNVVRASYSGTTDD